MVWKPHVTVAAIIEQNQRFLLVEETTSRGPAFNQPAGHLEAGESLLEAVVREVQEETAWRFEPEAFIAAQLWRKNARSPSFLRFCFSGSAHTHNADQPLDTGIIQTHWLSHADIIARRQQLRSPLVLKSIDQYLSGRRYPLSLIESLLDIT
ncbi:MAG: NUDIX hydrolase [Methylomonas sp.]|jgi:ADP-ribose pyrophosphatase YjhB (NUDIX family)